jgi:hypothetical protein
MTKRIMTQPLFPQRRFRAILFDMDGTMLSSIAATERVWGAWARQHGLDVESFLPTIHGMRAIETMQRLNLPGLDLAEEVRAVERAEMEDLEGIEAIAGIAAFLHSLPADRWTIVTSASKELAARRLAAAAAGTTSAGQWRRRQVRQAGARWIPAGCRKARPADRSLPGLRGFRCRHPGGRDGWRRRRGHQRYASPSHGDAPSQHCWI